MKVIDCTQAPEKGNAFVEIVNRLEKSLDGLLERKEAQALNMMISLLGRGLSHKFFLLQNVTLEGSEKPIPMILVGHPGIYIFNVNTEKGIYRAKNDTWSELKGRRREFKPARPNLIQETLFMGGCLEAFLANRLINVPTIRTLLFLLNPGAHVDTIRPAVRIIMVDGLERFVAKLAQDPPQLTAEEVEVIVARISEPPPTAAEPTPTKTEPADAKGEISVIKPILDVEPVLIKNLNSISNKLHFSTGQWILLGLIALINIILLIFFLIMFLLNT